MRCNQRRVLGDAARVAGEQQSSSTASIAGTSQGTRTAP